MERTRRAPPLVTGAVLGALVLGGVGGGPGSADPPREEGEARAARSAARVEEYTRRLAGRVGVTQERVRAALEELRSEERTGGRAELVQARLETAVDEGRITSEQADSVRRAARAGLLESGRGHRGGHHGPRVGAAGVPRTEATGA